MWTYIYIMLNRNTKVLNIINLFSTLHHSEMANQITIELLNFENS